MSRIVIVTPGQLGMNPRTVKEASALSVSGHSVHVISTRLQVHLDVRDADILKDAAWTVERIDLSSRRARLPERLRQIAAQRLYRVAPIQALAATAHSPIARVLYRAALATPADLYIAHYPAALPAAVAAARRYGARYAFDAEDFHLGDLPERPENNQKNVWIRRIERNALPGAAYITAASPMIAAAYSEAYNVPLPTVVLNTFPLAHAPIAPTPQGCATPGPSIYWFSQTIGPGRGLETAIRAIAIAKRRPHLYLRGTATNGYARQLRQLATSCGAADRLHFLPPGAPSEMERLGSAYDIGYVGELDETHNRQIALTNKIFSYLIGGLPIVASDIPAHRYVAPDLGPAMRLFSIGHSDDLAAVMDCYLMDQEHLAAARATAWQLGQDRFNFETEAETLVSLVDLALLRKSKRKATP